MSDELTDLIRRLRALARDGEYCPPVVNEAADALEAGAYPGRWFKATKPLPDGWWWWRHHPGNEFIALDMFGGEAWLSDDNCIQWHEGEWCGPITLPPKDAAP